jgi:sugar transferase (PEP-CTERM/EpsH1 system associated)
MIRTSHNHAGRPALLYLVHRIPYPPDKGDRIRTFQFLRYLARTADVHLACLADEPVSGDAIEVLRRYCKRLAVVNIQGRMRWGRALAALAAGRTATEGAFHSAKLRALLRDWAAETGFHAALASSSSMVSYLRTAEFADVPAVVDLIDIDSQKWFDYASAGRGPKSWLYRLEGRRLRRLEKSLPAWAHAVTLVSDAEVAIFRQFCREGVVVTVGNGVDLDYFRPQPEISPSFPGRGPALADRAGTSQEQGCVFLGALDYWPNVEGICRFCREIWPEIRQRLPEATISLVGRRPVPAVCRLVQIPGVNLIGAVPDVRPYLAGAAVSIVPLRIARGVQNKVLESLAMGKATIVSPQALEGIAARSGEHLLTAHSPTEWIDGITHLLGDPSARRRLGQAGRRFVENHHDWARCLSPLDKLLGLPTALPAAKASA